MELFSLCFVTAMLCGVVLSSGNDCSPRNVTAAQMVDRPCRKPCRHIGDERCKGRKRCMCDRECGYSCINISHQCPIPPIITHMRSVRVLRWSKEFSEQVEATIPYRYNDVAQYTCEPGFSVEPGAKAHFCHGRRGWTGYTECTRSCRSKDLHKVRIAGMICGAECKNDSWCEGDLRCLCDGACGRSCVNPSADCGIAPPSNNATIAYTGDGFEKVAHYSCNEGFFFVSGSTSRKCTGGGTWDGEQFHCERVQCQDPLSAMDAMRGYFISWVPGPYYVGQQLTFACKSYHTLIGARNRTCMSNGRWSGQDTVCTARRAEGETEIRCPHPGVPIGGRMINRRRYQADFAESSVVNFACDEGYALVGEAEQECLFFQEWSGGGAPKCIDPRIRDSPSTVVQKLVLRTQEIENTFRPAVGRFIGASLPGGHEIYFLFDLSESVKDRRLNTSLNFAVQLVQRLAANATGSVEYGIIVFAINTMDIVNILDVQPKTEQIIERLWNILLDRENIQKRIKKGTHTSKALQALSDQLETSYQRDERKERERHVFIFTDGKHNAGKPPGKLVKKMRARLNAPTFYSITSCSECADSTKGGEAYEELRGLAAPKENFILINDLHEISRLLAKVTDAAIDYSKCGQAGDTGNVREQARVRVGRVLSRTRTKQRSWPWQVLLSRYHERVNEAYQNGSVLGGGSIINNRWVLTAAHLFQSIDQSVRNWHEDILLSLGIHKRPFKPRTKLSLLVSTFKAGQIIIHQNFDSSDFDYDIAMVKLGQEVGEKNFDFKPLQNIGEVNYTAHIRPVCLPCMPGSCVEGYLRRIGRIFGNETQEERCRIEADFLLDKGAADKRILAVATGFGHTETVAGPILRNARPAVYLRQGLLEIKDNETCATFARSHIPWGEFPDFEGIPYTKRMLCAVSGVRGRIVDTCQGDSGGPLVRQVSYKTEEEHIKFWVQIGVVSWGWGCGRTVEVNDEQVQIPGYYTNVMEISSWINKTLHENS